MTEQWQKEKNEKCLHSDFLMHYSNTILRSGDQYNLIASHRHPKQVELKVTASRYAKHLVSSQETIQLLP